jgi:DnaJ-domain-containing protein 1
MNLIYLIAGLMLLGSTLLFLRWLANANPAMVAGRVRQFGWFALIGLIGFAAFRFPGLALFAIPAALPMIRRAFSGGGVFQSSAAQPRLSEVETEYLSVELDHDSGAMNGMVKKGAYAGRPLDALERAECQSLAATLALEDRDGFSVFAEYYQRRFGTPLHEDAEARAGDFAAGYNGDFSSSPMDARAAADLLGVDIIADRETVNQAYRAAMKSAHPDRGGSAELAARLNRARDLLLERRH